MSENTAARSEPPLLARLRQAVERAYITSLAQRTLHGALAQVAIQVINRLLSFAGVRGSRPACRRPNILDEMVTCCPSDQTALDIFRGEWSSRMPTHRSDLRAGKIPLFDDPKVSWAISQIGGVEGRSVLELGPLEGGHTYILHEHGAASITAIECNTRAFLKCLIVKNLFKLDRAEFMCGDFVSFLEQKQQQFDFVLAAGVLYHMTDPAKLLELLSRVTSRLFVWTHYYDDTLIRLRPGVSRRFVDHFRASHAGFPHTLHRYEYGDALTSVFTGGARAYSCWMERKDILFFLEHFGFNDIRIAFEQTDHPHGPAFALLAQRAR